jgi:hypothetical protein
LETVKTLEGLLPMCCYCNGIRDDKGYWQRVETYIASRSFADFTHSICPACARKHFPGVVDAIKPNDETIPRGARRGQ